MSALAPPILRGEVPADIKARYCTCTVLLIYALSVPPDIQEHAKAMQRRDTHTVNVPGPLWRELLALQQSKPAFCPNPSNFILDATRNKIVQVQAGGPEAARPLGESPSPPIRRPDVIQPSTIGADSKEILSAIGNAGTTGITAKQLSTVTGLPSNRVEQRLSSLSQGENISKFGRGLWVLQKFADANALEPGERGPAWYDSQFESRFRLKIGRYKGDIQFSPNERLPAHRWWPYVQGFSAAFVTEVCTRYAVGKGSVVLDPFCGSGTVSVVARLRGATAIGVDMMPIVAFVTAAKCEWDVDPTDLERGAKSVLADRSPTTLKPPFLRETAKQFTPEVMQSLLRLKENIWTLEAGPTQALLKLAFSSILIDASNLKRAPCLGYARKGGLDATLPFQLYSAAASRMVEDLRVLQQSRASWGPPAKTLTGSSGQAKLSADSVDLAITSPPYVNGMDYPTNYKIELAWLDFVESYVELAHLRASMVACDNIPRGTATGHRPSESVQGDDWISSVTDSIARNIRAKGAYRRADMPAIVRKYFDDLVPVISNVFRALRPGGRFVVVNGDSLMAGTYVPGDAIFGRLAAAIGFEVEGFDIARSRRSGQRRGFILRETVLTLRKPARN
jgi:DNA modification methylase